MPYRDKEYSVSNVEYINKDFADFKTSLLEYAKSYFPDTYQDFNETSPGMMLIEMSAYVGDVLSFYIDQQYKEMMLPLAQERRNVVNIANMLGYKVKPTSAAVTTLTVTQELGVDNSDLNNLKPNFNDCLTIAKGMTLTSDSDSNIKFETTDIVDFSTSGSTDLQPEPLTFDSNGVVTSYLITRQVNAISSETKTRRFTVGSPTKFLRLTLDETNVISIESVRDTSTGNVWREVEFLAQDRVPLETHYLDDNDRDNAYSFSDDSIVSTKDPVPYSLKYIKTSKKFITEINSDGKTSLVFGNGVLRNQKTTLDETDVLDTAGITLPDGVLNKIDVSIDPLRANDRLTLGEAPFNTTLEVTYKVGGGIDSNVSTNDLTTINSFVILNGDDTGKNLTATNNIPAKGGQGNQNIEDIRRGAKAYFAAQNRCVTKEDYEARALALPAKFGSIGKVYCKRTGLGVENELFSNLDLNEDGQILMSDYYTLSSQITDAILNPDQPAVDLQESVVKLQEFFEQYVQLTSDVNNNYAGDMLATLELYLLTYDGNGNLAPALNNGNTMHPLKNNLINYLDNFRMLTDKINIVDGMVVNFGVAFEVFSHRNADKSAVKLRCINTIQNYFNVNKMFFKDTIHTNDLYYELMDLEGVRSVSYVELTQDFNNLSNNRAVNNIDGAVKLWDYNYNSCPSGDIGQCTAQNSSKYNWQYDFSQFYINSEATDESDYFVSDGVILPSVSPSVFELKNPTENIRGVVR
tara:strand:+ start:4591 stop:6834 length:2244 start_codon:yes stop_codon:yes gene_type:complete